MNQNLNKETELKYKHAAVALSNRIHGQAHAEWLHKELEVPCSFEESVKIGDEVKMDCEAGDDE